MALRLRSPEVITETSAALRGVRLRARERGDLESAIISAGYYAKKGATTMFVYESNSEERKWRVSCKSFEYLGNSHNCGNFVFEVTRDLLVRRWQVEGREERPS